MPVTVQFPTTGVPGPATHTNLYRKRGADASVRIAQTPINQGQVTITDSMAGDVYAFTWFDNVRFSESGYSPFIIASDNLTVVSISGFVSGIDGAPAGFSQDAQGNPAKPGVEVTVTLMNLSTSMPISDGQLIASLQQKVETDTTGTFVFSVVPNNLIYPSGTFYRVNFLDKQFFKVVDSTDGQSQLFTNLLDVPPKELR